MGVVIRESPCAKCGSTRASLDAPCEECGWKPEEISAKNGFSDLSTVAEGRPERTKNDWLAIILAPIVVFAFIDCVPGILMAIPQINIVRAWPRLSLMLQIILVSFCILAAGLPFVREISLGTHGYLIGLSVSRRTSPVSFYLVCVMTVVLLARFTCVVMLNPF